MRNSFITIMCNGGVNNFDEGSYFLCATTMTEPATSSSSSQIPESQPQPQTNAASKKPIVIVTIGMAGSGKTTFVQRINSYLHSLNPPNPPYILNLDPAVASTPFDANIDIRDTVNYKEVMKQCVLRVFFRVLASPG